MQNRTEFSTFVADIRNLFVMKVKVSIFLTMSLLFASCGTHRDFGRLEVKTIGNRVAEQFLASDPLDYGNNLPGYQAPYNYGRGGKEMNYSHLKIQDNG